MRTTGDKVDRQTKPQTCRLTVGSLKARKPTVSS